MREFEDWVITPQQRKLYLWGQSPANSRGAVLITHGQAEHSGCYKHVASALVESGLSVWAWDLFGHGKSEGKRGYVREFSDYIEDFIQIQSYVQSQLPSGSPMGVLAHSMGGLIQTRALIEHPDLQLRLKFQALSSPLFGLSVRVPVWKDRAARLMARVAPRLTLYNEIKFEMLTHAPEFLAQYPQDSLRHDQVGPTVYVGMLESFEILNKKANLIRLPTLLQQAGADLVVSRPAAEKVYAQFGSRDKEIRVYEGLYHEILNEIERAKVLEDLKEFVLSRLKIHGT